MSKPTLNIIILGAGIAGTCAAIGLVRKGYHVTVLENRSEENLINTIANAVSIYPNATRVLDEYGIIDEIKEHAVITAKQTLRRYDNGQELLARVPEDYTTSYNYPKLNVVREAYTPITIQAARNKRVQFRFGCHIVSLRETDAGVTVTLDTGEELRSDLLVGADGIGSITRKWLIPDGDVVAQSSRNSYSCRVPLRVLSESGADDLMDGLSFWLGPGKIVVGTPFPGFYDLHLHHPSNNVSPGEFATNGNVGEMKEQFKIFDEKVRRVVEHVTDCKCWALKELQKLPTWVSSHGRAVILGDAAHAMLPTAGQGACMCLEDGAALAECLDRARTTDDISTALHVFERIRMPRVAKVVDFSRGGMSMWTLPDGAEQENRDRKFMEESRKLERARKARGSDLNVEREPYVDPLAWILSYDVFKETNEQLDNMVAN